MDKSFEEYFKNHHPDIPVSSAASVLAMAADGATVPFMARYRKEKTGNLDEVQIRAVLDRHEIYENILKRKEFILTEVEKQGNLTAELKGQIVACMDLPELEEIYRPYKKKRKTRATMAREAGIGPFADWLWELGRTAEKPPMTLEVKAKEFINPSLKYATYDEVLKGAHDILVEKLANNPELREAVRSHLWDQGKVVSKAGKQYKTKSKYEMYADFKEPAKSLLERRNSHRYLAMRRGWNESELTVSFEVDDELLLQQFFAEACPEPQSAVAEFMKLVCKSALSLHVLPSVGNEVHSRLKEKSDADAIEVFAENVRKVLLASPYGAKCVLGVDPGLRTGCKLALVDRHGRFISHTVVQIQGDKALEAAQKLFEDVLKQVQIDAIGVGNGTGGREAERFFRALVKELGREIPVVMVNEAGASIYSASEVAREEYPDLDLTVRGAISIARRLQDPLAELVKIEPKSIGVGQYQHDVSQTQLKKKLTDVVESCVNTVGVDLNTASTSLLKYISGIGPVLAQNIVSHREKNGLFKERADLLKVERFSPKVFEQAAGFLRITDGNFVLDRTGVHPERYGAVQEMVKELKCSVSDILGQGAEKVVQLRGKWAQLIGEFTFDDIVKELAEPGRDPRDPYEVFQFREDVHEIKDLKPGMICSGIVTNVTSFGAFVDIGVHQNGLVHISELSQTFVNDPTKVLSPGDQVKVRVLEVDLEKNQIALSSLLSEEKKTKVQRRGAPQGKKADGAPRRRGGPAKAKGGKPRGGGRGEGRPSGGRPTRPFNNPFAALGNLKNN